MGGGTDKPMVYEQVEVVVLQFDIFGRLDA